MTRSDGAHITDVIGVIPVDGFPYVPHFVSEKCVCFQDGICVAKKLSPHLYACPYYKHMKNFMVNIFSFVILMLCSVYVLNLAQAFISLQAFVWVGAFIFVAVIISILFFSFFSFFSFPSLFMGFILTLYHRFRPDCGRAFCIDSFYVGDSGICVFLAVKTLGFIKAINTHKKRDFAPRFNQSFKQTWRFSPL